MHTSDSHLIPTVNPLWENIPADLKALNQWCVSTLPDKAPKYFNNERRQLENASPTTGPFHTFTDACSLAQLHGGVIGCCVLKGNALAFIDFDIKDLHSFDKDGEPLAIEQHTSWQDIEFFGSSVSMVNTYCELSQSGKGLHIIAQTSEDVKSCRAPGKELYTNDRYFIFTGNTVSKLQYANIFGVVIPTILEADKRPIKDESRFVSIIQNDIESMRFGNGSKVELVEIQEAHSDVELWKRAREADNEHKFIELCRGNWKQLGYPSQSEADMALMSMFTFYSQSNEQCRRLFRKTELGKRTKAIKNDDYLNRTLQLIRGRQETENQQSAQIDLKSLQATHKARTECKSEIPQSSDSIPYPPGFAGELAKSIYDNAYLPVPEVAIAGALGLLAGICGKAWSTPTGAGLNLYIVLLARSGIGKEALHKGINNLMAGTKKGIPSIEPDNEFIARYESASAPALVRFLSDKNSVVHLQAELGKTISKILSPRANQNDRDLGTLFIRLYNSGDDGAVFGGKIYSDREKNTVIGNVAYSLLGESTPKTFQDAITQESMADGFLSRLLVIEHMGIRPLPNRNHQDLNDVTVRKLGKLLEKAFNNQINKPHSRVSITNESKYLLDDFEIKCGNFVNQAGDDEGVRQLWNRAHLKCLKVASLLAVADNFENPVIQINHAEYSLLLIRKYIESFLIRFRSGEIGDGDDVRSKKVISVCKKVISGNVKSVKPKFWRDGVIPRRAIIENTKVSAFLNHPHKQVGAVNHTIKSLISNGQLADVSTDINKKHNCQGTFYRLLESD